MINVSVLISYFFFSLLEGRISEKDLEKHVSKDTSWYICGPPPMIESISKLLTNIGVPRNCIFFEKWW